MAFVIRSMSATDFTPNTPSVPYEVFLLPPHKRHGAWWTKSASQAMTFYTEEDAIAEWKRCRFHTTPMLGRQDIAPKGHPVPVWEAFYNRPREDNIL